MYSRVREMASWITAAAKGVSTSIRIPANGLFRRSSRSPPNQKANRAMTEMIPAMPAAMVLIRISLCFTWLISWPSTPATSRGVSISISPVVTQTAACSGFRPVAKALGSAVSTTYTRGMGSWARRARLCTMPYS